MGNVLEAIAGPDENRLPLHYEVAELLALQASLQTAVISPPSSETLTLLQPVWEYLDPSLPFPPPTDLSSPTWRRFGFQSDDPIRDIRGGGLLALEFLHFMVVAGARVVDACKRRRLQALEREQRSRGGEGGAMEKFNSYPFACACIGVVRFVSSLFNICSPHGGSKDPSTEAGVFYALVDSSGEGGGGKAWFFKLCCLGVEILEETWVATGADCYMLFPRVQATAQETIRETLLTMAREKAKGGDEWKRHFVRGV